MRLEGGWFDYWCHIKQKFICFDFVSAGLEAISLEKNKIKDTILGNTFTIGQGVGIRKSFKVKTDGAIC